MKRLQQIGIALLCIFCQRRRWQPNVVLSWGDHMKPTQAYLIEKHTLSPATGW